MSTGTHSCNNTSHADIVWYYFIPLKAVKYRKNDIFHYFWAVHGLKIGKLMVKQCLLGIRLYSLKNSIQADITQYYSLSKNTVKMAFLAADMRLYSLWCWLVNWSVHHIFELRALFAFLLLPIRPQPDCCKSGLTKHVNAAKSYKMP